MRTSLAFWALVMTYSRGYLRFRRPTAPADRVLPRHRPLPDLPPSRCGSRR